MYETTEKPGGVLTGGRYLEKHRNPELYSFLRQASFQQAMWFPPLFTKRRAFSTAVLSGFQQQLQKLLLHGSHLHADAGSSKEVLSFPAAAIFCLSTFVAETDALSVQRISVSTNHFIFRGPGFVFYIEGPNGSSQATDRVSEPPVTIISDRNCPGTGYGCINIHRTVDSVCHFG